MKTLLQTLSSIFETAFAQAGLPQELGLVKTADRPDLAQFQCNGALQAAKLAKKPPRAVAEQIVAAVQDNPAFEKLEIAGPGFINITLTDAYLTSHLGDMAQDDRLGVPMLGQGTMILDYGGPNVAKAMHVGHLRTALIGDAINRIARFAGYKTISDVHLGDWGTPMGMVISELEIRHPDWPYFDVNQTDGYPESSPVTMADLEQIYPAAAQACKDDPARADRARQATVELQQGRPGYRALWTHFVKVSVDGMKENYALLNVAFDLWKGEADVHDLIAPMVEDLKAKNLAIDSDGALVIPVASEDDTKEIPPLILYKRDGAVMYGTTDLATLVDRRAEYAPDKIVYVVDQRQHLHFEQVFRAAKIAGIIPDETELTHAGFGTMNGPDGRPFKTRAGGVMTLHAFLDMAIEKSQERMNEANLAKDIPEAEKKDIAHKVALAAIRFADLQNQRQSDYIFDLDRLTSFEGKTGPYLLYQAVRIKSLLRKAGDFTMPQSLTIDDGARPLALTLTEFPESIAGSIRNYMPSILCEYLYRLAQAFSGFYAACPVLNEKNEDLRITRLALCQTTLAQMEKGLSLLGIDVPDQM